MDLAAVGLLLSVVVNLRFCTPTAVKRKLTPLSKEKWTLSIIEKLRTDMGNLYS